MKNEPGNFLRMTEEMEAFLQDIKEHPEDDVPRLIFSDWLEERGDPRGSLMRLQCELSSLPLDAPKRTSRQQKEQQLEKKVEDWLQPKPQWLSNWESRRGLWKVYADLHSHPDKWSLWVTAHWWPWMDSLRLRIWPQHFPQRISSFAILALNELDLRDNTVGPREAQALANSPHVRNLISLNLQRTGMNDEGIATLSRSPHLSRLRSLDLSYNVNVTDAGISALMQSREWTDLREMNLTGTRVSREAREPLRDRFGAELVIHSSALLS